jgi:ubiquitin-protein ligase
MSISPEQLGEIHHSLQLAFRDHPVISIIPVKGDPPERYEITYNISGYSKTSKNNAKQVEEHRVELTIPFGFPHFPPSCKPKTDIFHPDFDPAAVCLGDFWKPGNEVADLIVHMGRLINGEFYSIDNAFNEEAAKWYKEHSDLFPLAKIHWKQGDAGVQKEPEEEVPQIDTIEDSDLTSDFDYLSLESTAETELPQFNTAATASMSSTQENINYLYSLKKRKKFFKLTQIFERTPPSSDEARQLYNLCSDEINKAEELYRAVKEMQEASNLLTDPRLAPSYRDAQREEAAGYLKKATRLLLEIGTIVSDYPNLEADRRLLEASLALLKGSSSSSDIDLKSLLQGDSSDEASSAPSSARNAGKNGSRKKVIAVKTPIISPKTLAVMMGTVATMAIFGFLGLNYYGQHQLEIAAKELASCNSLLDANNFEAAKSACEQALLNTSPPLDFLHSDSTSLKSRINESLNSEKLRQGLAGMMLFNGKYLPKNEVMALESFSRLQKEAEAFFSQQKWSEGEERYLKLLVLAEKGPAPEANSVKEIKSRLAYLRFAKTFSKATTLLTDGKWQEATGELQKAKGLLGSLPEEDRRRHEAELNAALAKCNFEEFRKLGDDFFSKSDWTNAINTYKAALPTADKGDLASQETLKELRENIARAELYATIDAGNKAFTAGKWEEAIVEYNKAGSILSSQLETIKTADAQFTRKKIERIILQTMVIRDRQAAQTAEIDKKDPITARNIYRQLVATLNKSGFAGEEEFAEIKKTSLVAIEGLDKKIYLGEKENYLKDNFRSLFQQNYPAAVAENLTNPQVSFIRDTDSKLIFKMQCNETGQGRPLTLIMFYAYDKSGKLWQFHSEQQ